MKKSVLRFVRDEEGATAVEYGLIAGLIAAVIIVAVTSLGTNVRDVFQYVADSVSPPSSTAQ